MNKQIQADPSYFVIGTKLLISRSLRPLIKDVSLHHMTDEEKRTYTFSAFLGIISFKKYNYNFLVMVQDARKVATIQSQDIYQILKVHMICIEIFYSILYSKSEIRETSFYQRFKDVVNGSSAKEINDYLQQISNILQTGHYFSFSYSISQSLEDQSKYPLKPNIQFLWNYHLMEPLRNNPLVNKKWCIQLIQGFVTQFSTPLKDNQPIQYTLITRRSSLRGGTRYNHRGIDEDGNAANFCESEQILQLGSICCSHRQIRGSIPLFWEQIGFQATLQLTKSEEENKKAFLKHFEKIKQDYSNVMCVNLMSKTKNHELLLTQQFENFIQKSQLEFLRYEFFDFHEACKGFHFENVNQIADSLKPITDAFKFFAIDNNTNKILFEQSGVVRTNCLDCLDRTNVFMAKIAGSVVENMMNHMNKDAIKEFDQPVLNLIDECPQNKKMHPFMVNFKHSWADNGDHISKHYAGTGATTTKATKQGNIGFMGFIDQSLKGIERFYKGNFEDQYKQECLDIITGKLVDFSHFGKNTITWNAESIKNAEDIIDEANFIRFERSIPPDLICISLQNVENLESKAGNQGQSIFWTDLIKRSIAQFGQEYKMVSHYYSTNSNIMVTTFVLTSLPFQIILLQSDEIFTASNGEEQKIYGCVGVKYQIEYLNIGFLSCYLPDGINDNEKRIQLLNEYMTNIFIQKDSANEFQINRFKDLDIQLLLGNLNFQIGLANQLISDQLVNYQKQKQENNYQQCLSILNYLLEFDQFKNFQKLENFLSNFKEGGIQFSPQQKKQICSKSNHQNGSNKQENTQIQKYSWQINVLFIIKYQSKQNNRFDRIFVSKESPKVQFNIQSYQLHEEILGSSSLQYLFYSFIFFISFLLNRPVSSSIMFNFLRQEQESQEIKKQINEGQKIYYDAENPPRIFEFFKPPQIKEVHKKAIIQSSNRQGNDNNENHSASLDASVSMIMNTNEEDQDEQSQSDRNSLLQNILNEGYNNYELGSNRRLSNHSQNNQLQQQNIQQNLQNQTEKEQNKSLDVNQSLSKNNRDDLNNKSGGYNVCFFDNQKEDGKQFNLPLIKDYVQFKDQHQNNEAKNYECSQNGDENQVNYTENDEKEDQIDERQHRKMSSFDISMIEDKHIQEGKQVLSVIKEE